jgi:hypothetical protein
MDLHLLHSTTGKTSITDKAILGFGLVAIYG